MNSVARSIAILLPALLGGCSSFHEKWGATGKPGHFQNATRWDGRWTSGFRKMPTGSAEGGRLRCVVEPVDRRRILAHFHANWLAFSADYTVPLTAARQPGTFTGTHDLPEIFGGTYRYSAQIGRGHFSARYSSRYDAGTFEMTRQLTNPARIH